MTTFATTYDAKCQSKLSAQDRQLLIDAADSIAECKARVKILSLLMKDTALLGEANRNLILSIEQQKADAQESEKEISLLHISLNDKDRSINLLKDINQDLEKKSQRSQKRFGIGPYAGYGLSGMTNLGVSIGIGVTYSFIRF